MKGREGNDSIAAYAPIAISLVAAFIGGFTANLLYFNAWVGFIPFAAIGFFASRSILRSRYANQT